jgi:hypothetical protein
MGWKKLMFIKYYRKNDDMDIDDPLKHPMWGAILLMVLQNQQGPTSLTKSMTICYNLFK